MRGLDRRALRQERGLFRVEGPQAAHEAIRFSSVAPLESLYLSAEAADRYPELAEHGQIVPSSVIAAMSEATTPQGVVGVARLPHIDLADIPHPSLVVVAVDVRDPGNLGTMIRTADAVGASAFIAANSCVDPFSPKVVRSSVGSHWHLPIVTDAAIDEVVAWARSQQLRVLAADGDGTPMDDVDLAAPTAWLLGNEAWGLPTEIRALADDSVSIPVYGKAESLNVAIAGAVLLYASARAQRH